MTDLPDREKLERVDPWTLMTEAEWARLQAMTEEELHQNALLDPDNPPLTDDQLARMRRVPNPQEIRQQLGLTQREFSKQYQIALGTLRDWEQGARRPDSAAKAYLRVIQENPGAVLKALEQSRRSSRAVLYQWTSSQTPAHSNAFAVEFVAPLVTSKKPGIEVKTIASSTATSQMRKAYEVEKSAA